MSELELLQNKAEHFPRDKDFCTTYWNSINQIHEKGTLQQARMSTLINS